MSILYDVSVYKYVMIIPQFVRLYKEIIHQLKQVDYLPYRHINYCITNLYLHQQSRPCSVTL